MPFSYPKIIAAPLGCNYHPIIVGERHCRVLTAGNINFDATGNDITGTRDGKILSCCLKRATFLYSR